MSVAERRNPLQRGGMLGASHGDAAHPPRPFNQPFPTQEDRACRGRHEDAEGAQRAQCPNGSIGKDTNQPLHYSDTETNSDHKRGIAL